MTIIYTPGNEPENIKLRISRLFEKLDSAYPDKVIVSLHKQHKHWGETVTALYRELGYESGNEFLQSYGYTIGVSENKGGGQIKNNYNEIIDLLKNKYKSGAICKTIGELKLDNPEYAKAFKTMQNKAKDLFGMSLNDYLKQEGILSQKDKPDYSVAFQELLSKYGNQFPYNGTVRDLRASFKDVKWSHIEYLAIEEGKRFSEFLVDKGVIIKDKPTKKDKLVEKDKIRERVTFDPESYRNVKTPEEDFVINETKLIKYTGNEKIVVVPKGIKEIGSLAFEKCDKLNTLVFPKTVERIAKDAYDGCEKLTFVVMQR